MQVVVQELLTNYSKSGSGKVVLLLHGWGDSSKSYANFQANLAKKYCVVSLDLPGFGATQAPTEAWGLNDYDQFIEQFLSKIGIGKVYALVGHSNGGALAIYGLANNLLDAQKLILIGSAGIRDKNQLHRSTFKVAAKAGKAATFWLPKTSRDKLRKKLYGAAGSEMLDLPHMQETFKKTVEHDVQADASTLTLPTLIVYGQNDAATPPAYGEIYNSLIKGSSFHAIPEAGHFVHQDQPSQVFKLIEEFLK